MKKHPYQIAVGEQIRAIREAKDYSQEGFANEEGFGRSYFGEVERGDRDVSMLNLIRIAQVLGVEVGDLFPPIQSLRELPVEARGLPDSPE